MLAVFIALALCAAWISVSFATPHGQAQARGTLVDAARAPFLALVRKNPQSLCSAFTPSAAKYLGRDQFFGATCEARARQGFADTKVISRGRGLGWARRLEVTEIRWHDRRASAVVVYGKHRLHLSLRLVAGRWRIATKPVLGTVLRCVFDAPPAECVEAVRVADLWSLIPPSYELPGIPVPARVRRAGGKELHDFKVGARTVANAGCLACHRIGSEGNAGPGPSLTHVASRLPKRAIERVMRHPSAPMPSFKNLPRGKFKAIVRFLLLLR